MALARVKRAGNGSGDSMKLRAHKRRYHARIRETERITIRLPLHIIDYLAKRCDAAGFVNGALRRYLKARPAYHDEVQHA